MSRTQVALFLCALYGVIGVVVDGGLRPMTILMVVTCGPLALHWLTNPAGKEASHG
ncbi:MULTISPECIES: hypothetical protein [Pseudomonas]|uniref:hypothetical protein n=1 Tax=Pseudomonas sp. NY5710 TaxID=2662033 RepID=UPI00156F7F36|nr:hypothetical protein [Pseudomonas sp. NY5710]